MGHRWDFFMNHRKSIWHNLFFYYGFGSDLTAFSVFNAFILSGCIIKYNTGRQHVHGFWWVWLAFIFCLCVYVPSEVHNYKAVHSSVIMQTYLRCNMYIKLQFCSVQTIVFVISRTENGLILSHFSHCLLLLVFFIKVGYCCIYMQLFLQISVLAGCEQNSRPSEKAWVFICVRVTVCVCVPLCVFVWGGVGACMNVCSCLYCFKYRKVLACPKCYN